MTMRDIYLFNNLSKRGISFFFLRYSWIARRASSSDVSFGGIYVPPSLFYTVKQISDINIFIGLMMDY